MQRRRILRFASALAVLVTPPLACGYGNRSASPLASLVDEPSSSIPGGPDVPMGVATASVPGAGTLTTTTRVLCASGNAVLCDDFEQTAPGNVPDPNVWGVEVSDPNDRVEVVATLAAHGEQCLHVHSVNSDYQHAVISNRSVFANTEGSLYSRAFVLFRGDVPHVAVTLLGSAGMPQGAHNGQEDWVRFGFASGGLQISDLASGQVLTDNTPVQDGNWLCIETMYDAAHTTMRVWANGFMLTALNVDPNGGWQLPPLDRLQLGWETRSDPQDANVASWDIWYDNVAFSTQRIGCGD